MPAADGCSSVCDLADPEVESLEAVEDEEEESVAFSMIFRSLRASGVSYREMDFWQNLRAEEKLPAL